MTAKARRYLMNAKGVLVNTRIVRQRKGNFKKRLGNINAFQTPCLLNHSIPTMKRKRKCGNIHQKKGNRIIIYFDFCPIFSFNFSPPPGVAGVDGVPGVDG